MTFVDFLGSVHDSSQERARNAVIDLAQSDGGTLAILGPAGSGKTELILGLLDALRDCADYTKRDAIVCAPTNRAVDILRRRGAKSYQVNNKSRQIDTLNPMTLHRALYRPCFQQAYHELDSLLSRLDPPPAMHVNLPPGEYYENLLEHPKIDHDWQRLVQAYHEARRDLFVGLNRLGLDAIADLLSHWEPRSSDTRGAMLIIDECSMLTSTQLQDAQQAFERVVLVGDPNQLPPIIDKKARQEDPLVVSLFQAVEQSGIPVYVLDRVYRQSEGSRILDYAQHLLNGGDPLAPIREGWVPHIRADGKPRQDVEIYFHDAGEWLLELIASGVMCIVWTNNTRKDLIRGVRHHRGLHRVFPQPGEPVAFKNTKAENINLELLEDENGNRPLSEPVNNETGKIFMSSDDKLVVRLEQGRARFRPHWEDFERHRPHRSIPVRFAYAMTCHMAQGGQWERVIVDYDSFRGLCKFHEGRGQAKPWLYTAVTRASRQLIIVDGLRSWLISRLAGLS